MTALHIDDFYHTTAEILCTLYAAFPVRHLLLVEDISGPIRWDMTGLPDRRSRACFETLIWLSQHDLMTFRSVEPRDIGIEGAVLTQKAFVLLTGSITWDEGASSTRIEAIRDARARRAHNDVATIVNDLLRANCAWGAPTRESPLRKAPPIVISGEDD